MTNEEIRIKNELERAKQINRTMRSTPIEYRGSFCESGKCNKCVNCKSAPYGSINKVEWASWLTKNPDMI